MALPQARVLRAVFKRALSWRISPLGVYDEAQVDDSLEQGIQSGKGLG